MVRILSFENEQIDEDFYRRKIESAYNMRKAIGMTDNEDNNTFRLVHGEGDNLPGLVIDVYGKTAVMQAHSVGMHEDRMKIANALKKVASQPATAMSRTVERIHRTPNTA